MQIFLGDWGLGIGDWGLGIGPNPQIPNLFTGSVYSICLIFIIVMFIRA